MENKDNYVGTGWQNDYGVNISINLEKLKQLPIDSYGNIKLFVGKRKEQDTKSKATHWVKESKPLEKKEVKEDLQQWKFKEDRKNNNPFSNEDLPFE